MCELEFALRLVERHFCRAVAQITHLLHSEYGYRPALVHGHLQFAGSRQILFGRGNGDGAALDVEVRHARHLARLPLLRPHRLAAVHPQLPAIHNPVALHRCVGHPDLLPQLFGQTAVGASPAPSAERDAAADYGGGCPIVANDDGGRILRSGILRPHKQGLRESVHAALQMDCDAAHDFLLVQSTPFARHLQSGLGRTERV